MRGRGVGECGGALWAGTRSLSPVVREAVREEVRVGWVRVCVEAEVEAEAEAEVEVEAEVEAGAEAEAAEQ